MIWEILKYLNVKKPLGNSFIKLIRRLRTILNSTPGAVDVDWLTLNFHCFNFSLAERFLIFDLFHNLKIVYFFLMFKLGWKL